MNEPFTAISRNHGLLHTLFCAERPNAVACKLMIDAGGLGLASTAASKVQPASAKPKSSASKKSKAATPQGVKDAKAGATTKAPAKKKSDSKKTDSKKSDAKKSDSKKADSKKSDAKKSDSKKADSKKSDAKKSDAKKTDKQPKTDKEAPAPKAQASASAKSDAKKTDKKDSDGKSDSKKSKAKSKADAPAASPYANKLKAMDAQLDQQATAAAADKASTLDKDVPPAKAKELQKSQAQLQKQLKAAAYQPPDPSLPGGVLKAEAEDAPDEKAAADKNQKKIAAAYWKTHKHYVDANGTVYNASYDAATGKVYYSRSSDSPTPALDDKSKTTLKKDQQNLDAAVTEANKPLAATKKMVAKLPPADQPTVPTDTDTAKNIKQAYYETHKVAVGNDGNPYAVSYDAASDTVTKTPMAATTSAFVSGTLNLDGTQVVTVTESGMIPPGDATTGGAVSHSETTSLDANGKPTSIEIDDDRVDNVSTTHTKEQHSVTKADGDGTVISTSQNSSDIDTATKQNITQKIDTEYTNGLPSKSVIKAHNADADQTQDATTTTYLVNGIAATSHTDASSTTKTVDGNGQAATVSANEHSDVSFDANGLPAMVSSTSKSTTKTTDKNGKPVKIVDNENSYKSYDAGIPISAHTESDTTADSTDENGHPVKDTSNVTTDIAYTADGQPTKITSDNHSVTTSKSKKNDGIKTTSDTSTVINGNGGAIQFDSSGMPTNVKPATKTHVVTNITDHDDSTKHTILDQTGHGDGTSTTWTHLREIVQDLDSDGKIHTQDATDFNADQLDASGMPKKVNGKTVDGKSVDSLHVDNRSWWDKHKHLISGALMIAGTVLSFTPIAPVGLAMVGAGAAINLSSDLPNLIQHPSWQGALMVGLDTAAVIPGVGEAGAFADGVMSAGRLATDATLGARVAMGADRAASFARGGEIASDSSLLTKGAKTAQDALSKPAIGLSSEAPTVAKVATSMTSAYGAAGVYGLTTGGIDAAQKIQAGTFTLADGLSLIPFAAGVALGARAQIAGVSDTAPTTVEGGGGPAAIPNPKTLDGQTDATYAPSKAKIFGKKGPQAGDVQQGQAGDCYYLSVLRAAAARDPKLITSRIHDNGNGTVTVQIGPQYVTVSKDLPVSADGKTTVYANPNSAAWPAYFEKAYAALYPNGYEAIGHGGNMNIAMNHLFGYTPPIVPAPPDAAAITSDIGASLSHDAIVTAATRAPEPTDPLRQTMQQYNLVPGHAYSVDAIVTKGGQRYVKLGNPHGVNHPLIPESVFDQVFNTVQTSSHMYYF